MQLQRGRGPPAPPPGPAGLAPSQAAPSPAQEEEGPGATRQAGRTVLPYGDHHHCRDDLNLQPLLNCRSASALLTRSSSSPEHIYHRIGSDLSLVSPPPPPHPPMPSLEDDARRMRDRCPMPSPRRARQRRGRKEKHLKPSNKLYSCPSLQRWLPLRPAEVPRRQCQAETPSS